MGVKMDEFESLRVCSVRHIDKKSAKTAEWSPKRYKKGRL